MKTINRKLSEISGKDLDPLDMIRLRGGDPMAEWEGECAVHHAGGAFWKLIWWRWEGTGQEAEMACTEHYDTNEEEGSYCFCNYDEH